jgi:hypothetical protein
MMLRRIAPVPLLALAIFACTPSVPSQQHTTVVTAVFDLASSPPTIPQPNDLVLQPQLNPAILNPQNAQDELLALFHAQGGFPADQVTPLAFPITTLTVNGPNNIGLTAPAIDPASLVPCTSTLTPANCNVFVFDTSAPTGTSPFPVFKASYDAGAPGAQSGTLSAVPLAGTKPTTWRPGAQYIYALRGGASGIKTTTGAALQPSSTSYTLIFGGPSDFVCPSTNPGCPLPLLGLIHQNYLPLFGAVASQGFPLAETVVVGSFAVAEATTWVIADPGTGTVPLPSNFLIDPTTNHVSLTAATALGIPALSTLDGFSTTAMQVAQTSGPILASTVRSSTDLGVYLYKLGGATPVQVNAVVTEPPPITLDPATGKACVPVDLQGNFGPGCVSTIVGIQPAVTVPTPLGNVALPPLEESTDYAVIITDKVKTPPAGAAISPTTLGQILLFTHPLCTPSPACVTNPTAAQSEIPGVPGPTAAGLEAMRLQLQPVVAQVATDHAVAKSSIMMPYTFRTQSITGVALQLGAAPYSQVSGQDVFPDAPYFKPTAPTDPLNPKAVAPATMAKKWGVPAALVSAGISTFVEANVVTYDKLDPATGAFYPTPTQGVATPVPAIIAIPAGAPPATGWPLVVFHHGLGRSRGDSLLIAQALAGHGMVVAAIDAAKHGARAWCTVNTTDPTQPTGCAAGVTCNTAIFGDQSDSPTAKPGLCQGSLALAPIACAPTDTACWDSTLGGGNSVTSGAFLISANFFRSRDTIRQDILDQSMLVRVLTTANGAAVLSAVAGSTVAIDPTKVFFVGQSLGSIEGTVDLASNPRFSRAVLNVGGATIMEVLTTAPAFSAQVAALLASLGATPGSPEFLLLVNGAKWILDPADPANFAQHVTANPLPNLLAGGAPQTPKVVLGQAARCDAVVPNSTNELLYGLMGLSPIDPIAPAPSPTAPVLEWYMKSTAGTCPTDGTPGPGVAHGFLLDWSVPALAGLAQQNAVSFLLGGPVSPTPVVVP